MLILATTKREYSWGLLRPANASKVKVILDSTVINEHLDDR